MSTVNQPKRRATLKGVAALVALTEARLGISSPTKGEMSARARSIAKPVNHAAEVRVPRAYQS